MQEPQAITGQQLAGHAAELTALARFLASDDPDDLVQDTMVSALTAEAQPRTVGPWLRQVLRNTLHKRRRSTRRRVAREQRSAPTESDRELEDRLGRDQLFRAMREELDGLDDPYRGVLHARFYEGRSAVEIATDLGCPPATVRWRMHEGLRRMRHRMDERFDGRSQWFGAIVAVAASPESAQTATTGTVSMKVIALTLAAGAAVVGGTVAVLHETQPEPETVAPLEVASIAAQPQDPARAEYERKREAIHLAQTRRRAAQEAAPEPENKPDTGSLRQTMVALSEECGDVLNGPLPEGEIAYHLDVIAEPEIGAVVEAVSVAPGAVEVPALTRCLEDTIIDLEIDTPDEPVDLQMKLMFQKAPEADEPPAPPAKPLSADGLPKKGSADGGKAVTIIECADFDCKYCRNANQTVEEVLDAYDEVEFHFAHNPLPFHRSAELKARAATAAQNQGKFWKMHDVLFENPDAQTEQAVVELARAVGLDVDRFKADLAAPEAAEAVAEQKAMCLGQNARATPTFFVNGKELRGARPLADFRKLIDEELAAGG